jgi:hypothetical protein
MLIANSTLDSLFVDEVGVSDSEVKRNGEELSAHSRVNAQTMGRVCAKHTSTSPTLPTDEVLSSIQSQYPSMEFSNTRGVVDTVYGW